ncbi:MAG: cation transporter [Fibrobacteraceae bacterium]|nr:cation transporter [Fibrobacteraceae bacterium]
MILQNAKKKHGFTRLVYQERDPSSYKVIEMHTLKVGIWINVLMGICGWVGYYFASSYALALDGSLCAISAVSFIIALYITRDRDVTSEEYPFGIYSIENVYALLQGILLITITVYAIFQGAQNIINFARNSGAAPMPLKLIPLLIYTIGMVFACTFVWLYYRRQLKNTNGESPILKSETVAAYMDTLVTIGTGLALILMAVIPAESPLSFLNYIGDSIIVIAISAFLLPSPLHVVTHSFFSLIGRTTRNPQLRKQTETIILRHLDPSFTLKKLHIFHIGSSHEVDATITPVDDSQMDISRFRESKEQIRLALKELYPNLILEILLD